MPLLNPLTLPATVWSKTRVGTKLVVAGTFLALGMWGLNYWLIDSVGGELCALILDEDTVYAQGYSDARWRQISVGMTDEEVHRLLSAPQNDGSSTTQRNHQSTTPSAGRTVPAIRTSGVACGCFALVS